jgi:UDP-N-acetylmuramoyl-tripeptide--D-alanyl-D-alanine ligase
LIVAGIAWFQPLTNAATRLWRRTGASRTHVVAVIGSYGKTTTVRALSTVLCGNLHRYSANNAGFFVNHAILRIRPGQKHAVIEVGISGFDQMAPCAEVVRPDTVVVTSIGSEHGRSFGTLSATRSEKVKMVEALGRKGRAVLCHSALVR